MKVEIIRTLGTFGSVEIAWRVVMRETDANDLTPTSGIVSFSDGQKTSHVTLFIVNDDMAEGLEVIDHKKVAVTFFLIPTTWSILYLLTGVLHVQ